MPLNAQTSPFHIPSPIESFSYTYDSTKKVSAYIKRDDLIHPFVMGNKWRKLEGFLYDLEPGATVITCGGPHSNHLLATAGAGHLLGYKTVGFVRGQHHRYVSERLQQAIALGMHVIYLTNADFQLLQQNPTPVLEQYSLSEDTFIPMGGAADEGAIGCRTIIDEIVTAGYKPDTIVVPAGTGRTATAMLERLEAPCRLLVFPAISSVAEIEKLENRLSTIPSTASYELLPAHRCRFGKSDEKLRHFIHDFYTQTNIQLDEQYNGKMMDVLLHGNLAISASWMIYHSGGTLPDYLNSL